MVDRPAVIGKRGWVFLGAVHAAVCAVAAVCAPLRAFVLACLVAILAMVRYFCMAMAARNLGSSGLSGPVAASGWIAALVALAAVLFVWSRSNPGLLAWPAAAALAGPAAFTAGAMLRGIGSLRGTSGRGPGECRQAHSGEVDA